MSYRSIFCIASSQDRAARIVRDLKEAEISCTEISILFHYRRPGAARASGPASSARAPSAGEIRGVLRWIEGIGPLVLPGIGPLIIAGPIAASLRGARVGSVAGGLINFGVPQVEAGHYQGRVMDGQILAAVHTTNSGQSHRAREIFAAAGAEDIFAIAEVTPPKSPLLGTPAFSRADAA